MKRLPVVGLLFIFATSMGLCVLASPIATGLQTDSHCGLASFSSEQASAKTLYHDRPIAGRGLHLSADEDIYGAAGDSTATKEAEPLASEQPATREREGTTIVLGYVQPSMETEIEIDFAEELGGGKTKAKMEFRETAAKSLRIGIAFDDDPWGGRFTFGFVERKEWRLSSFTADGKPIEIPESPTLLELRMYTQGLYVRRRLAGPVWGIAPHAGLRAALVEVNYSKEFFDRSWAIGGLLGVVGSIRARVTQQVDVFVEAEYAWGAAYSFKGDPSVGVAGWEHSLSGPRFAVGMDFFIPGMSLF